MRLEESKTLDMKFFNKVFSDKHYKSNKQEGLATAQQLLKDKIDGDGKTVTYEFERLRRPESYSSFSIAEQIENSRKNRYTGVLPFDYNRVQLLSSESNYINASFLESKDEESPSWKYIATQGPLRSTVSDFWQMVIEQNANVIFMLTRTVETSTDKCASYFCSKEGVSDWYGPYMVETLSRQELDADITARELLVTWKGSEEGRKILHYHYHAWPDHGVPSTTKPLRKLSHLMRETKMEGGPVVHCSAGIGRTGTFCTIDIILRRLRHLDSKQPHAAEKAVDVKRVVTSLRKQRAGMVQTPSQYLFCHQAIKDDIDSMLGIGESGLTVAAAQSPVE